MFHCWCIPETDKAGTNVRLLFLAARPFHGREEHVSHWKGFGWVWQGLVKVKQSQIEIVFSLAAAHLRRDSWEPH